MTDIDNFNRTWQGLTHGEVEDAIKAKAAQTDTALEGKYDIPSNGIPAEDLSAAVQALLENARTALQRVSYNDLTDKPEITRDVELGSFDENKGFHRLTAIEGGTNTYEADALTQEQLNTGVLYIDIQHAKIYRYNPNFANTASAGWDELIPADGSISENSERPVKNSTLYGKFEAVETSIPDSDDFIKINGNSIMGEGSIDIPTTDESLRLPYNLMPRIVLDGMGHTYKEVPVNTTNNGKTFFCTDGKIRYYYSNGASVKTYDPDAGLVYYDKSSEHFYRWDAEANTMKPIGINIAIVGADESAPSGADITFFRYKAPTGGIIPIEPGGGGSEEPDTPVTPVPKIVIPQSGASFNVGSNTGNGTSLSIIVKGSDLTQPLTVAVSGEGFSVSPTTISADAFNGGTTVLVSYNGTDANASGTLTISGSEVSRTVDLVARYVAQDIVDPVVPEEDIEGDDFNALLAGTNIPGEGEEQDAYNPANLYELGAMTNDALPYSYNPTAITPNAEDSPISVRDNIVYYNYEDANELTHSVRTPMRYRGDIVVSNTTKMADTGDMAYLSFMVAGPFFAAHTDVTVVYNSTEVTVQYWKTGNAANAALENINSGESIRFGNTDAAKEVMLVVKRKATPVQNGVTQTLITSITLSNGHKNTGITVIYNPTRVFYKVSETERAKITFPAAEANALPLAVPFDDGHVRPTIIETKNGLQISNGKYCPLKAGVEFDMSKFNVFYVVLTRKPTIWVDCLVYDNTWGGAWAPSGDSDDSPLEPRHRCYYDGDKLVDECRYNAYMSSTVQADTTFRSDEFDALMARVGRYVLKCYVHKERDTSETLKSLDLYIAKVDGVIEVKEFGIITYLRDKELFALTDNLELAEL